MRTVVNLIMIPVPCDDVHLTQLDCMEASVNIEASHNTLVIFQLRKLHDAFQYSLKIVCRQIQICLVDLEHIRAKYKITSFILLRLPHKDEALERLTTNGIALHIDFFDLGLYILFQPFLMLTFNHLQAAPGQLLFKYCSQNYLEQIFLLQS